MLKNHPPPIPAPAPENKASLRDYQPTIVHCPLNKGHIIRALFPEGVGMGERYPFPWQQLRVSRLIKPAWKTGKAKLTWPKWPTHSSMRLLQVPQSPRFAIALRPAALHKDKARQEWIDGVLYLDIDHQNIIRVTVCSKYCKPLEGLASPPPPCYKWKYPTHNHHSWSKPYIVWLEKGKLFHSACKWKVSEGSTYPKKNGTLPETSSSHLKWMVGRLVSFWEGLFSGDMLGLGRAIILVMTRKQSASIHIEILSQIYTP